MRVDGPTDICQWFGIEVMTLEPGAVQRCGDELGPGVGEVGFVAHRGSVRFETDGPALFGRRGGDILVAGTQLGAGDATLLEPGDQGFTGPGVVSRRRNVGAEPAVTLELSLTTFGTDPALTPNVTYVDLIEEVLPLVGRPKAPSPSLLSLLRVTLPPYAEMRVHDLPSLELLAVESGRLSLLDGANPLVASGLGESSRPSKVLVADTGLANIKVLISPASIMRNLEPTPTVLLAVTEQTG